MPGDDDIAMMMIKRVSNVKPRHRPSLRGGGGAMTGILRVLANRLREAQRARVDMTAIAEPTGRDT